MWTQPPVNLDLQPHHVDVWRVSLDIEPDSVKQMESTLSSDETERAARFQFDKDKHRSIIARGSLRDVLSRYLGCKPSEPIFSINKYGKPALDNFRLEFNVSHSGDFVLIAVAQDRRVGVDIERVRQGISSFVIAKQYFSKAEVDELQSLPLEQRETAFFACWSRKEAYIKAHGLGLSLPLESFDVSLTPNEPATLRATRPDEKEATRWTLMSFEVNSDYGSAIAVEGHGVELRLWDWNAIR